MPMPKDLNSMALHVFMAEYEYFATRPQRLVAIAYLVQKGTCNEGGAERRVSAAKRLFDNPTLLREALEYVAYKSSRATHQQKEKATRLIADIESN